MPMYMRKSDFVAAPAGLHGAVLCDVTDLGELPTPWGPKPKIELRWQIEAVNQNNGKRFLVSKRYNNSQAPSSNLRLDLESWRNKKFSDDEMERFDLEALLGKNCQLQIMHNTKDGTTYANVNTVLPPAKGQRLAVESDYVRVSKRPDYKPPMNGNGHAEAPQDDWAPAEEYQAVDEDIPF